MKEKLHFDEWIKNRYKKIPDKERYVSRVEEIEYKVDDVVNEYLEYYNTKLWGKDKIWKEGEINEGELIKVVFSIDEEILSELDTGESPHPMIVGNLLNHNICEFCNSSVIPTDSRSNDIHPTVSFVLIEWLNTYADFINWNMSIEEDFWNCFK